MSRNSKLISNNLRGENWGRFFLDKMSKKKRPQITQITKLHKLID